MAPPLPCLLLQAEKQSFSKIFKKVENLLLFIIYIGVFLVRGRNGGKRGILPLRVGWVLAGDVPEGVWEVEKYSDFLEFVFSQWLKLPLSINSQ